MYVLRLMSGWTINVYVENDHPATSKFNRSASLLFKPSSKLRSCLVVVGQVNHRARQRSR